ncbi:MAG: 2,3,4,5-tetrahydropyridine-2,6-dicarboxylate N-succinyltransferase [Deltaproteobacteria bacterium]|nr:2,3,4,5-tetrahydropyridine-2,6-dicarboxylate N-succinyltransferase [Deltaproteobacteria bacterium]
MSRPDDESLVAAAFEDRTRLADGDTRAAVLRTIDRLDAGELRVASPPGDGADADADWVVHAWVKQAVLLYFGLCEMQVLEVGPFEYHDKIPLKTGYAAKGVRVVPPATVRKGAFVEAGAILMPSYVNIGAWVGAGTMVDTWATVGSCAQIGRGVHLSGGVGIGGVLEPPGARPVIIEDGAFLGSRAIVVEGVRVGREAVLGAGVVLAAGTRIIDVSGSEPREFKGYVPPRSVVIPGSREKRFPAGTFHVPVALIIGERKPSTDQKTSLNQALRDFDVTV